MNQHVDKNRSPGKSEPSASNSSAQSQPPTKIDGFAGADSRGEPKSMNQNLVFQKDENERKKFEESVTSNTAEPKEAIRRTTMRYFYKEVEYLDDDE